MATWEISGPIFIVGESDIINLSDVVRVEKDEKAQAVFWLRGQNDFVETTIMFIDALDAIKKASNYWVAME
jgi:hypothetical protein